MHREAHEVKNKTDEHIYFDRHNPDALANILETQHKITNLLKKRGDKQLFQILIITDDFADDPSFTRTVHDPAFTLYPWEAQRDLDHNCDAKT